MVIVLKLWCESNGDLFKALWIYDPVDFMERQNLYGRITDILHFGGFPLYVVEISMIFFFAKKRRVAGI